LYGFYYGRALYEGMQDLPGRRPLIYARSVWAGSQRYPAIFLGDQKPTYLGMRSTLRAGLNLSMQGFAYWTADVFGLDGKTTPETHMRYAQWALLNPIARYFWRPPEVDGTRFPWSHGPQVEANFRKYADLRYRLLPYYVTLGWQALQTGLPLLRPLLLEFQSESGDALDADLAGVEDQLMLGNALMLCPVIEAGAVSRRIRLPPGTWHDFWSAQSWQGPGEIDYPAPLDCLPILARGGTVIPMGPPLQSIPDNHHFDAMQFHFWPPYPSECSFYDEDGRSMAYQQGAYAILHLAARQIPGGLRLQIDPAAGGFPEMAATRQVELVLHRAGSPRLVTFNEQSVDTWEYDAPAARLHIRLVLAPRQGAVVDVLE
jgi:alpha-glucosidase (family GH31 glycosyl hydrolase)